MYSHINKKSPHYYYVMPFEIQDLATVKSRTYNYGHDSLLSRAHFILWLQKGHGCICVDNIFFQIDENIVYCIKGQQKINLTLDESAQGFLISFSVEFLNGGEAERISFISDPFSGHFPLKIFKGLRPDNTFTMNTAIQHMLTEFNNSFTFRLELLKSYLKVFLLCLSRLRTDEMQQLSGPTKHELITAFKVLLEEHFMKKKKVMQYAALLGVSAGYLNDTVRCISGFSAGFHIRQRVIAEAKRKAMASGYSMKEVAWHLGFPDQAHFSKYFKNNCGKSFTDYKKEVGYY
jgi:AraC family transcriptional activator of pobA